MPGQLLAEARDQAERSNPSVRAAALLRIARVETAFDREQARRTFQRGLDAANELPDIDGESLLPEVAIVAAAVVPDVLRSLPPNPLDWSGMSEMVARVMLDHGRTDALATYVLECAEVDFPFHVGPGLLHRITDETLRSAIMRRGVEAWRTTRHAGFRRDDAFVRVFQAQWRALPSVEALQAVQEVIRFALDQPDRSMMAILDREQRIQITSHREYRLFQILHILRHLEPSLAESLVAGHEQLAAAARCFPNGVETIMEEAEARRRSASATPGGGGGSFMCGTPADMPYLKALMEASRDGDFGPAMEHALERYRRDSAPDGNRTAREFWPSTCTYRSILYRAGKKLGRAATVYLDRIPDPDLRLFAQIELAAALAGLPELQGIQRGY